MTPKKAGRQQAKFHAAIVRTKQLIRTYQSMIRMAHSQQMVTDLQAMIVSLTRQVNDLMEAEARLKNIAKGGDQTIELVTEHPNGMKTTRTLRKLPTNKKRMVKKAYVRTELNYVVDPKVSNGQSKRGLRKEMRKAKLNIRKRRLAIAELESQFRAFWPGRNERDPIVSRFILADIVRRIKQHYGVIRSCRHRIEECKAMEAKGLYITNK